MTWNFVCSIVYASTTKIVQIVTPGWPWHILCQGQIWWHRLLYGKKWKLFIFLETVAALGLKVAWTIQLNELMKLSEYQRSRSFFDLSQRSLRFQSLMFYFWPVYSGERFRASWPSCLFLPDLKYNVSFTDIICIIMPHLSKNISLIFFHEIQFPCIYNK